VAPERHRDLRRTAVGGKPWHGINQLRKISRQIQRSMLHNFSGEFGKKGCRKQRSQTKYHFWTYGRMNDGFALFV